MALTANIVERTVGGETDKRFQLAGGAYTRTIKEGSSWNKLRIGIRLSTTRDSAWTSPPKFYFGLCSGTTAPPGSITPNHFLGISNQGENASNFNWGNSTDYITWGSKWSQPIIIENGAQRSACDGGQASASYNLSLIHI